MRMLFGKNWNFQKVRNNSNYLEVTGHSETIFWPISPVLKANIFISPPLIPRASPCFIKKLDSVLGLERWGGPLCGYFSIAILTLTLMPTLPDYPGVSRIRNESPGLPYGWPILPDKYDFEPFLRLCSTLHSRRILRWREFQFLKIVLPFLNAFQHLRSPLRLSNPLDVDKN